MRSTDFLEAISLIAALKGLGLNLVTIAAGGIITTFEDHQAGIDTSTLEPLLDTRLDNGEDAKPVEQELF